MKILVIHNDYQKIGGETVVYQAQVRLLRNAGYEVIEHCRSNDEILHYKFWQKVAFLRNTVYSTRTYEQVKTLIKNERPDIAHIHNVFPLISPSVYRCLADENIPIVQTLHNVRFLCPNGLFYTGGAICERCKFGNTGHAIIHKCYRNNYLLSGLYALAIGVHRKMGTFELIHHYFALTDFTVKKFLESGFDLKNKISVLGNFLPDPLPEPWFQKPQESYVAFMGRLSVEKGVDTILKVAKKIPDINFVIAGDGPESNRYKNLVKDNDLTNVWFVGEITGNEKMDFLRHARCVIIPSISYESFPMVTLESMAVGTPVIASKIGGLPYLIEDGKTGLLFQPGDVHDLIDKIRLLFLSTAYSEKIAAEAFRTIKTRFSEDNYLRKLIETYQRIISK